MQISSIIIEHIAAEVFWKYVGENKMVFINSHEDIPLSMWSESVAINYLNQLFSKH